MAPVLLYLIKASVCLIVFYLFFKAFLSNETFFRFNRRILLFGTIVCFVLPVIQLPVEESTVIQMPFLIVEEALTGADLGLTSVFYETERLESYSEEIRFFISFVDVFVFIYFIGLIINLMILFKSFVSMHKIIRKSKKTIYQGYTIVLVEENISPFSWFKYIVISKDDFLDHPNEIITHEAAHIQFKHSLDLILYEFFILLQWFNPAIWLLKKELKDIHEYEADMYVIRSGIDATRYQLLLVKKAVGSSSYTLANSFNHSKLKKRITMMLKEKSNKWSRLKFLLLVPLSVIVLCAFSRSSVIEKEIFNLPDINLSAQDKNTTIIPPDQKEKAEFYHVFIYNDTNDSERRALLKSVRLTPDEYKQFLNQTKGNFAEEKDLIHLKSGYATSRGYWQSEDGGSQQTVTVYHELSGKRREHLLKMEQTVPPPPPFFSKQVTGYPDETENYFLLINRLGDMLFQDDFVFINNLEEELSQHIFKNRNHKKPVVLTVIHDQATRTTDLEKIFGTIQQTFSKNGESSDSGNVFARIGDPKEFGLRKVK